MQTAESAQPPEILMTFRGRDYYVEDLPADYLERYEKIELTALKEKARLLASFALEKQLVAYAVEHDLTLTEAGEQLFGLDRVSEDEVSAYYDDNEEFIGKPYYEVRVEIERVLNKAMARKARLNYLQALMEAGDLAVLPEGNTTNVDLEKGS